MDNTDTQPDTQPDTQSDTLVNEQHSAIEISQDSKNIVLLNWLGTLFFGFIPSLVLYLVKTDDDFIREHAKEALNWSITLWIGYFVAFLLLFILVGVLIFIVLGIANLVFCILAAVAGTKGESYQLPYTLRLIK